MASVSIRELRNNGGEVVDRAARGESIIITRAGRPVAELNGLQRRGLPAAELVRRWRALPALDARALRAAVDAAVDPSL